VSASPQQRLPGAVIGIDVGGTKISVGLFDASLQPLYEVTLPTPPACQPSALEGIERGSAHHAEALRVAQAALLEAIAHRCRDAINLSQPVQAIGIGMAGQIDTQRGIVLDANENLLGAKGMPAASVVHAACHVPVYVDNDVRVMALAELTRGAAQGCENALCLTVGTGIGGALIQQGRVWHGAHFCAGEIGYLYAGDGHTIEALYSGPGISRAYAARSGDTLPLPQIVERAQRGDASASHAITSAAAGLGRHLAPIIALLDPQRVIMGGGVADIGSLWWDVLTAAIRQHGIPAIRATPIVPAAFGAQSGVLGAGILAAYHCGVLT